MSRKQFKISDEQIKSMYLEGYSLNDIAKVAQDTKGLMALRKRLIELEIDTHQDMKRYANKLSYSCRKYHINETVFDKVDTEEKAYWLGFLFSDGYNNEHKHQVSLRLQEQDTEVLEKFKVFLNTDKPIYKFYRITAVNHKHCVYSELNINSIYLSTQLAYLGCVQAKSLIVEFPMYLPKSLRAPFIRGYFDGNGCVTITDRRDRRKAYGKSMRWQLTFVSNPNFINQLASILAEELSITIPKIQVRENNKSACLHFSGKEKVSKILEYMYKDATVYLERKYKKYQEYCISAE